MIPAGLAATVRLDILIFLLEIIVISSRWSGGGICNELERYTVMRQDGCLLSTYLPAV